MTSVASPQDQEQTARRIVLLGASETPGELAEEFETLNERWKVFRKRRDVRRINQQ